MSALVVRGSAINGLNDAVDRVRAAAIRAWGLPHDAELHGHDVFHGKGAWRAVPPRARFQIYSAAMAEITNAGGKLFFRGIDRAAQARRYHVVHHPHRVTMSFLLEAIDRHVASAVRHAECGAVVFADEHAETASDLRGDLRWFQRVGTSGWRSRKLTSIYDTLHFVDSSESPGVQCADMASFIHFRRRTRPVERTGTFQASREAIWQRFAPTVAQDILWTP